MTPFHHIALICVFSMTTATACHAADPVTMTDTTVNYTMQVGGDIAWNWSEDKDNTQSSICAATPEDVTPLAMICASTQYTQKQALTAIMPNVRKQTIQGFLEGACTQYKCGDTSGMEYKDFATIKGWELKTILQHPSYTGAGIADTVFVATITPDGYLQLFSLHTKQGGNIEKYIPIFNEVLKTVTYTK